MRSTLFGYPDSWYGKGRYIALPHSLFEVSGWYYVVQYRVTGAICKALAHADLAGYYSFENVGLECGYERRFVPDPHGIFVQETSRQDVFLEWQKHRKR